MTKPLDISVPTYNFSIEAYHNLVDAAILTEDDKVELIEGKIITMSPINSPHAACVERLGDLLRKMVKMHVIVRNQNPIILGSHSEPEPDLAVARYREDYYEDAHPSPDDLLLVVEVAESSENYDRNIKLPLYAKYGISEAWLVNLNQKEVEVYRNPSSDGYGEISICRKGEEVKSDFVQGLFVRKVFRIG